ncbi:protein translocase subunit SecF [Tomitella biformata]|uniref:protein translocase subunit SecF n=1 Tax=Tomitella biformata TaxID=630403 RepID=UPI000465557A|nr:protein translocase subunit SecF [Tomitella biformata]
MSESIDTGSTGTLAPAAQKHGLFSRLYTGTGAFDIVGKRKIYYAVTAVVVVICALSILIRGFSFSIDFEGGSRVSFPANGATTSEASAVFTEAMGFAPASVNTAGSGAAETMQIQTVTLDIPQTLQAQEALLAAFHPVDSNGQETTNAISVSAVSSTWGDEVTKKALLALIVFMVIVGIYIAIRFERDMAIAALFAVVLDLIVTAGLYSIVGFEVGPATVIGLLTILGYSLYDTVVVFDKVEENTEGILHLKRRTYAEQANLAINQTLMRSINTSLTTILPIISLMVIAVWMLGVGTLKDLSLVLLIGILVGTYSSIFTATPLLVSLKERQSDVKAHNEKVLQRRAVAAEKAAAAQSGAGEQVRGASFKVPPAKPQPGARPKGKKKRP